VATAQLRALQIPSDEHFRAFRPLLDGDYNTAGKFFAAAPRLKAPGQVWIDSVAYHTMIGECHYHMGNLSAALEQYTAALTAFAANSEWLLRIEFPASLQPDNRAIRKPPTWGPGQRTIRVARVPDSLGSRQGQSDAQNLRALREGGVLMQERIVRINVREMVRCTALAIRRRAEIMGPTSRHDPLFNQIITALSARPAPPRHWAQAWVSAQLGLAYAAAGRKEEAVTELKNSLLAGGMDHMLTSTSLLELGKLAFKAEEYQAAATYFLESSLSAAMLANQDFTQYDIIGEALRWGMITHVVTGQKGMYPPLLPASVWGRREPRSMLAWILLSAAENQMALGNAKEANAFLEKASREMARREIRNGNAGARRQFITAQVLIHQGDLNRSNAALATALAFQKNGASKWLMQIALADGLYTKGGISTLQAGRLFEEVLRDPTANDWAVDPLECLSVLTKPHPEPFEHWFLMTLERKEQEKALRISDRLRCHRFYSSLGLGGRLLNLRWILEANPESLPQSAKLARQDFLARYPVYAELSQQDEKLQGELRSLPLAPEQTEDQRKQESLVAELEKIAAAKEQLLNRIALSREASEFVFPPQTDPTEVQQRLSPRQQVLSFVSTRNYTFAFMLSDNKYSAWKIESPSQVRSQLVKMLRDMGHYDRNQPVSSKELANKTWKQSAASILNALTGNAPPDAWDGIEELIVVPDGPLWYVPFEALQVGEGDQLEPLIAKVRIRYVPTVSLAVPDARPRLRVARTGVVAGRLFPRDDDDVAQNALADLKSDDASIAGLSKPIPPFSGYSTQIDRLIVLTDLDNDSTGPYDWSPLQIDKGKAGSTLAAWISLPWGGPDQVVMPGFHTAAENALKRGGAGYEVFLQVCGLMATGSRTLLLSRWRDGGQTSFDLVREFVRELPHRSASDSWQRSIRLAITRELDPSTEPRVRMQANEATLTADHPFFWAAYMLIDTGAEPK
jgi:CHAT domain-containing protein